MIDIAVINKSNNPLPHYQTPQSAGMDICAFVESPIEIKPGERELIATGLFIALPNNYEAQIRPRSGLALKHGITVLNSPGTIDSDYRGEIKVLLINHGTETFTINTGDRIAQMIIAQHKNANWQLTENLDETERGIGGYGHTGIQ